MGRYTYNSGKVTQAIDELNDALSSLSNVTTEIQAGINTINNANGSACIEIDYSKLLQLQTLAEDVIEEDIRTIQSKVTVIEEYENAPWYKKLFSSIGMGLTKFVEGVVSGIENITDGAVSIVGFVGGIFNSDFKNSVAEYVAKDHVGDWFNKQYDEGFLSGVSKYSWFSEDSTAANIFKGFGTAAPYIALSMTGVGTTVEVIAAGLGGVGSGTEAGINKALMNDPNLQAGDVFNRAFGQGVMQGAKNAALVYAMNKIRDVAMQPKIGEGDFTATEKAFGKMGEFADTRVGKVIDAVDDKADDVLGAAAGKTGNALGKLPGASTVSNKASQIWKGITNNKFVKGATNAVVNTVRAHPGAAYAAAGTVFALDQVDEDVINSEYRKQQEQIGSVSPRPQPTLTSTPFPTVTSTGTGPLPTPTSTGSGPQPTATSTGSGPQPTPTRGGGGGGGYTPTPSQGTQQPSVTTPGPSATTPQPSATTPQPTQNTPQPSPTQTQYQPKPTYSQTSYNPTPTTGGGGYTEEGYTGEGGTEGEFDIPETDDMSNSVTDIIGGNEYTNIPTSAAPITTTTTTGTKKSMIPVVAGLGAAAVAGIGTKAFLDKKEVSSSEEDFDTEEWTEEDSLDIDYNEAMEEDGDYLDPTDEYAYQDGEEETSGSYEAVNSSELASMQ